MKSKKKKIKITINYNYVKNFFYELKAKNKNYDFVGKMFKDIEEKYKKEASLRGKNPQQSWNSWSGKTLEKLLTDILKDAIMNNGFPVGIAKDDDLRKNKLSNELDAVRRNITVFYSHYSLVPDADIIVYSKIDKKVIFIFSSKASLRERVAQAAYWKIKLTQASGTKHIYYYLVSTDNDKDFDYKQGIPQRDRIIVEEGELDGAYIFRNIPESQRVKNFSKIFNDLHKILSIWFKK